MDPLIREFYIREHPSVRIFRAPVLNTRTQECPKHLHAHSSWPPATQAVEIKEIWPRYLHL